VRQSIMKITPDVVRDADVASRDAA